MRSAWGIEHGEIAKTLASRMAETRKLRGGLLLSQKAMAKPQVQPPGLTMADLKRKPKIAKSYAKMAPKLAGALKSYDPAKSTNLSMKLRHHAGVNRLEAGVAGKQGKMNAGFPRIMAQDAKRQATALNTGASNAAKRKRYLP